MRTPAVSRRLAEEGATVACTDLKVDAAEATADGIRDSGGKAIAVEHDVTSRPSWENVASRTDSVLAAPSAENSPTEWPTTTSGRMPRERSAASSERQVVTSAGC